MQSLHVNLYDEYDAYSNYVPNILEMDSAYINNDNLFKETGNSSYKWKETSNMKGSALQFICDVENGLIKRPITAVQGAGYVSRTANNIFDPLNLASQMNNTLNDTPKELSLEDRIKNLENQVMQLVDESCIAEYQGKYKVALEKAKEASSKEHSLIRLLEQSGHDDSHNFELTYSVLFTVAHQYVTNEMYTEALNMYKGITDNKVFQNGIRLKINIGNIYAKLGMYHEALKIYRWVLDRIPNTNKEFRTKILHNIGIVFIKLRKLDDACTNFEYVMQEKPGMNAGFHAIVCHFFLGDVQMIKKSFQALLNIPLEVTEIQNKLITEDNNADVKIEILKRDELSHIIEKIRQEGEKSIITASNLISPIIEETYAAGFNWCLEMIKNSEYFSSLSGDLEINKAVAYLRNVKSPETAIDALKSFDKRENRVASLAYSNLAFIYFFLDNLELSEKQALQSRECDMYSAVANINMGNCFFSKKIYEKAKEFYNLALENDSSCIEALYNLGLAHKKTGLMEESLTCFKKLHAIVNNLPDVLYQIGNIYELSGDIEQAVEWYLQLLGIIPSDIGILQKLADIYDNENDKQQAYHYYSETYRYYPSNVVVLDWLGEYFAELRLSEKAITYFEKAALVQPQEPKWKLLVGSCYRQAGNYQKALHIYKKVLHDFPNNTDSLKLLIRVGRDLSLKETNEYVEKLKKIEKSITQRNNYSGGTRIKGNDVSLPSSRTNSSNKPSRTNQSAEKDEFDYVDPVGPLINDRPRTSVSNKLLSYSHEDEEFGDDDLNDDLLPL
ncbi:hypothetical protein PGB90_009827 [Kerria lacca]